MLCRFYKSCINFVSMADKCWIDSRAGISKDLSTTGAVDIQRLIHTKMLANMMAMNFDGLFAIFREVYGYFSN